MTQDLRKAEMGGCIGIVLGQKLTSENKPFYYVMWFSGKHHTFAKYVQEEFLIVVTEGALLKWLDGRK